MISLRYPIPQSYRAAVTQTFAEHEARRIAQNLRYYNGGIDWGVPTGTPITAAAGGVVDRVGRDNTGYGEYVRIQHNDGYLTLYGHLQYSTVGRGKIVYAGDVVGCSDNTGNSTGPHLHFELRHNNTPIDPAPYFLAIGPGQTEVEPDSEPGQRMVVTVDTLNVRAGPGVQYPSVGRLRQGEQVDVQHLSGETWVQIGPDRWCALVYGQDIYLEPPHA